MKILGFLSPAVVWSVLALAAKCLCVYEGFGFEIDVQKSLPETVMGDEARAFQEILHMIGYLLNMNDKGTLNFWVFLESDGGDRDDKNIGIWRSSSTNENVHIKFDFQITQEFSAGWSNFNNTLYW